jgi:hypothetical protein
VCFHIRKAFEVLARRRGYLEVTYIGGDENHRK